MNPLIINGGKLIGQIIASKIADKTVDEGIEFIKRQYKDINKNRKLKQYAKEINKNKP
ncbi:MAG: hypothetical protein H8D97_00575 [Proteobacteria bacterium]|nr:hypothetical protein [Pseudomonadota bacterium]